MRPRGRLTEEQARELMLTQADLTALTSHPSWPTLEREVRRKEERWHKQVLALTLGSGNYTHEQIAFIRGFIAGMNWFIAVPSNAESRLEELLKREGIKEVERGRS